MTQIVTHCALRLGDGLAAMHWLRKMAHKHPAHSFRHYAHEIYIPQLQPLCEGVDIELCAMPHQKEDWWQWYPNELSLDLWKNSQGFWDNHPLQYQYADFMLEFFADRAQKLGLESPLTQPRDLLFDYPELGREGVMGEPFDFLIVNSTPMSNQAMHNSPDEMERLIGELHKKYSVITTKHTRVPCLCTEDGNLNVTQIGQLSKICKYIIMVSTGPSWPTFNIWSVNTIDLRVIIIDKEVVNLTPNTHHRLSASGARQVLEWRHLL